MRRHIRFCLKSLVFETRSCLPGQIIDVKWSSWTWRTLCCLFVIFLHFKILSFIWFEKVVIQWRCIFLLMNYILKIILSRSTIYLQSCVYLSCQRPVLENFFLKLFELQQSCKTKFRKFAVTGMRFKPWAP